jgi:hypothetical protein
MRMGKISWTDHARKEVSGRVNDERNDLHTINEETGWIGHILDRKFPLKHVIGGKIAERAAVTGRRARRR